MKHFIVSLLILLFLSNCGTLQLSEPKIASFDEKASDVKNRVLIVETNASLVRLNGQNPPKLNDNEKTYSLSGIFFVTPGEYDAELDFFDFKRRLGGGLMPLRIQAKKGEAIILCPEIEMNILSSNKWRPFYVRLADYHDLFKTVFMKDIGSDHNVLIFDKLCSEVAAPLKEYGKALPK
ncbi:hypothetical protein EHQ52_14930 [Leptospira koniambonensis]|uniref:Lipoprotein n=1 Tax=Leptospira koniambonensis TaxID=2484950 RepID=A0A4R9J5H3_9LEPT|nr:hypothetical protein [Leptospira koniambonensis]TGL32574.1 hypothetical protein EHQ52_14930 [Leptospira koniambonensis]